MLNSKGPVASLPLGSPMVGLSPLASTDPFRPLLTVSSKVFQVVFVHFVYNSALFSASCCCSFMSHVVAILICCLYIEA